MKIETPIYRIETESIVLRPWLEDEAEELSALIFLNLDHLRRWLPWAHHEPEGQKEKRERIRRSLIAFSAGEKCAYGIYETLKSANPNRPKTPRLLGSVGLEGATDFADRFDDPDRAGEIGYWLEEQSCGIGIMSVAVAAVTRTAFETLGLAHLEIQCDPNNTASAQIPERLGYHHLTTLSKNTLTPQGEPRDTMIWLMNEATYPGSPSSKLRLRATTERGVAQIEDLPRRLLDPLPCPLSSCSNPSSTRSSPSLSSAFPSTPGKQGGAPTRSSGA